MAFKIVDVSNVDAPELVNTVADKAEATRTAADFHAAEGHPIQVIGPDDEVIAEFPVTAAEDSDSANAQAFFSQALKLVLQTHQQRDVLDPKRLERLRLLAQVDNAQKLTVLQPELEQAVAIRKERADEAEAQAAEAVETRKESQAQLQAAFDTAPSAPQDAAILVAEIQAKADKYKVDVEHETERFRIQSQERIAQMQVENALEVARTEAATQRAVAAETKVEELKLQTQERIVQRQAQNALDVAKPQGDAQRDVAAETGVEKVRRSGAVVAALTTGVFSIAATLLVAHLKAASADPPVGSSRPSGSIAPVVSSLSAPELKNPGDGAHAILTALRLEWGAVPGALQYRVQIAETPAVLPADESATCDACAVNDLVAEPTFTDGQRLRAGKTYFWHVRAGAPPSGSPWSRTRTFTARAPASQCPKPALPPPGKPEVPYYVEVLVAKRKDVPTELLQREAVSARTLLGDKWENFTPTPAHTYETLGDQPERRLASMRWYNLTRENAAAVCAYLNCMQWSSETPDVIRRCRVGSDARPSR